MEKQTFDVPEGCKSVTVEQEGNRLVVTFEAVKVKWEPKKFDIYFYMNGVFEAIRGSYIPDNGTENGNCFQTEAECQKYCDYMKEMSLNYVK